jgi:hypothetical protein
MQVLRPHPGGGKWPFGLRYQVSEPQIRLDR